MIQLNPQQQAIVNKITGPCLVIAGAGSGKTRVIIQKILHLIKSGYSPNHIYAITFTNKAAHEMMERIQETADELRINLKDPQSPSKVKVSTFHTLGKLIIESHSKELNFKSRIILQDSYDQRLIIQDILDKYNLDKSINEEVSEIANYISECKNKLIFINEHENNPLPDYEFGNKYWKIYQDYVNYMHSISAVDFDDMLMLPCYLFKNHHQVLKKWRKAVNYLLVDEYQDTNVSQLELIKYLMNESANFTMVGDDDQSIYSWRGADARNLQLLETLFPQLEVFKLEQNYRCTQLILDCANKLIANNPHLYTKTLFTQNPFGAKIKVLNMRVAEDEADFIANQINSRAQSSNFGFSDFAILYRSNYQSRELEQAFIKYEIPYSINGDNSFYELTEIKDIVAYLRVMDNPDDDKSLLRIINKPARNIGSDTVEKLGIIAKENDCSIHAACYHHDIHDYISPKGCQSINDFLILIENTSYELQNSEDAQPFIQFIEEIGYYEYIAMNAKSKKQISDQTENVRRILKWIQNWMDKPNYSEPLTLSEIISKLFHREINSKRKDHDTQAVQMMTMHSSKGLEFNHIYIIGAEEGTIPHSNSETEEAIQEERRLFYVSLTRAKESLTISYTKNKKSGKEEIKLEPSRFLSEIPEEHLIFEDCSDDAVEQRKAMIRKKILKLLED